MIVKTDLAEMTWPEARDRVTDRVVALLPVGSLEQNGPQCPLGTDTFLAEYFARRLAAATDALLLPTIRYGCSQAFQGFPGTIALHPDTLRRVAYDILRGALNQGIRRVLVVNNHGPNGAPLEAAVRDVRSEAGGVLAIVWPAEVLDEIGRRRDPGNDEAGGHGGLRQTAAMLAIRPDAVRMDLAVAGRPDPAGPFEVESSTRARFRGYPVNLCLDMDRVSASGVSGDPTTARAEQAAPLLEELVRWGVELVHALQGLEGGGR
jgi:creatinine amidohydrolase